MKRRPKRLARQGVTLSIAAVAAGGLGFVSGTAGSDLASAGETPFPSDLGPYTIGSDCLGGGIDPVNVIFRRDGFVDDVVDRFADPDYHENEGSWNQPGEGPQGQGKMSFTDQFGCHLQDLSRATAGWLDPSGRYHIRLYMHRDADGAPRPNVIHGAMTSGDAHHEDTIISQACHAVDDQGETGEIEDENGVERTWEGGFNRGRLRIYTNWVINVGHDFVAHYWDNRDPKQQCNGNIAWSDGYTHYISLKSSW